MAIHGLYVYCNLAESVPVGDVEAPLLRVVSAKGKNGEMQQRNFDQLRYIPLQKKHFDSVEVFIRDDLGNPIPFESGKLLVTLHFKRQKGIRTFCNHEEIFLVAMPIAAACTKITT